MKRCATCRSRFFVRGGTIRVVTDEGEVDLKICKKCAEFLESHDEEIVFSPAEKD